MIRVSQRQTPASPFSRQEEIPGWDQDRVAQLRVLVAGVGALGNACLADLALTGCQNYVLIDFDRIETSNLSRTILFRRGDEGRTKVEAAAHRLGELQLGAESRIVPLDADVVWGVGWGVYRRVDIVLGCVDSPEARIGVARPALALGVPAIFGGISGWSGGFTVQHQVGSACVGCSLAEAEWRETRSRYSCDAVRRRMEAESRIPTTQTTSSFTAALMVQEALRIAHGDLSGVGSRIHVAGNVPAAERFRLRIRERCPLHASVGTVVECPELHSLMTAREAISALEPRFGRPVTFDLGRDFLRGCRCKGCGKTLALRRPRHLVFEDELMCPGCAASGRHPEGDPEIRAVHEISADCPSSILGMTLAELGLPPLHVIEVAGPRYRAFVEMTGDLEGGLPDWPGGPSHE